MKIVLATEQVGKVAVAERDTVITSTNFTTKVNQSTFSKQRRGKGRNNILYDILWIQILSQSYAL